MTVRISPSEPCGSVVAPPSKSMAHRMLICAGLTAGTSVVHNVAPSQDILATLDCLRALGAICDLQADEGTKVDKGTGTLSTSVILSGGAAGAGVEGSSSPDPALPPVFSVSITGIGGRTTLDAATLPCRESGSTLRFFTPLCLALGAPITLIGTAKLLSRPLGAYEEIARDQGLFFEAGETALKVQGPLQSDTFTLPGDVSSQFASGLLFTLPLLPGPSTIRLTGQVESRSYINMTLDALGAFDVFAAWQDDHTLFVPGRQAYMPQDVTVEGDWSNAAFFLALNTPGAEKVQVNGLFDASLQGDRVCRDIFTRLSGTGSETPPDPISLADCPDLGPVAFAYAAAHAGGTFADTRRLRLKESDRIGAMADELAKFGVTTHVADDGNTVHIAPPAGGLQAPAMPLDGHNDHRIVMALATLCTRTGGVIAGEAAVSKSFPDFFARLENLGVQVEFA